MGERAEFWRVNRRIGAILTTGIAIVVVAHTFSIWLWAASFSLLGIFDDFAVSVYFATVTYTSLGYGDVVVGPESRIFTSFAAIKGVLTFGISTAFLIGLMSRTLPKLFKKNE